MSQHSESNQILGQGIVKPSVRPLKVFVDENREWWLCDSDIDESRSYSEQGCTEYSQIHNK